jgi:hypothetical protein
LIRHRAASSDALAQAPASPPEVHLLVCHCTTTRRCSNHAQHRSPCFACSISRTAPLFQCVCALWAAPHLPFSSRRSWAACLLCPSTSTCAARPTNPMPSQAPGTGYAVALSSTHPHPRTIRATPLISVIAPCCGKFSAAILRWHRTSLRCHALPRKQSSPQMCMGRQSLPCTTRHHRICQCLGATLACTARPQAVKPQCHGGPTVPNRRGPGPSLVPSWLHTLTVFPSTEMVGERPR